MLKLIFWPAFYCVLCTSFMTFITWIIRIATVKFNCNDVFGSCIMLTTRFVVYYFSFHSYHFNPSLPHDVNPFNYKVTNNWILTYSINSINRRRGDIKMNLRDMMFISLFTSIIGVMAFFPPIMLPVIPVPITAQTLGVMLAGGVLGARRGGLSLLLFVALVAIGVPLLAGGRGGLGALLGPGGGYVWAWPIAAFIIGYLVEKNMTSLNFFKLLLFNIIGAIIIVYAIGVTYLSFISELPWGPTALSSLIFLPGDLIKAIIASAVVLKINQVYPLIERDENGIR